MSRQELQEGAVQQKKRIPRLSRLGHDTTSQDASNGLEVEARVRRHKVERRLLPSVLMSKKEGDIKFDREKWQNFTAQDKTIFWTTVFNLPQDQVVQREKAVREFLKYNLSNSYPSEKKLSEDEQIFVESVNRHLKGNEPLFRSIFKIVFDFDRSEFNEKIAARIWQQACESWKKVDDWRQSINLAIDIWSSLSVDEKEEYNYFRNLETVRNITKNILHLHKDEEINENHPLVWRDESERNNQYIIEKICDAEDHRKLLEYALKAKDSTLTTSIISCYLKVRLSDKRDHPLQWCEPQSEEAHLSEIFNLIMSKPNPSGAVVRYLWKNMNQDLHQKACAEYLADDYSHSSEINQRYALQANNFAHFFVGKDISQNSLVLGQEQASQGVNHLGILNNLVHLENIDKNLFCYLWERIDQEQRQDLFFRAATGGTVDFIENIIGYYEGNPIDENHPFEWRHNSDNTVIDIVLLQNKVNNRNLKRLLDLGATYPYDEIDPANYPPASANGVDMVRFYLLQRQTKQIYEERLHRILIYLPGGWLQIKLKKVLFGWLKKIPVMTKREK